MSRTLRSFLLFMLLIGPGVAGAQTNQTDFQTWYAASLTVDLPKRWTVTGQYRVRLTENASYYKGSYLFGTVEYAASKHFSAFINYRLALVDVGRFDRYALGVQLKQKWNDFTFVFRPMIQYQNQQFTGDDERNPDTDSYFRPRAEVKYKLSKRLDVYAYAEPFIPLETSRTNIYCWQNSIGFKYEFLKNQKINPYFIWQPGVTKKAAFTNYIAGIDVDFTIKPFRKKRSKTS